MMNIHESSPFSRKKFLSFCSIVKTTEWSELIKLIRVLFGCNSTFEHPAYLNSGKNDVEAYIY
jgi:hypothetical protein